MSSMNATQQMNSSEKMSSKWVLDERHGTDVPVRIIRSTIKLVKERLVQDSGIPALMALFE